MQWSGEAKVVMATAPTIKNMISSLKVPQSHIKNLDPGGLSFSIPGRDWGSCQQRKEGACDPQSSPSTSTWFGWWPSWWEWWPSWLEWWSSWWELWPSLWESHCLPSCADEETTPSLHPALKREDRLRKHPFAGFGTVMEDIKRSAYTKKQPILLGAFWENAFVCVFTL